MQHQQQLQQQHSQQQLPCKDSPLRAAAATAPQQRAPRACLQRQLKAHTLKARYYAVATAAITSARKAEGKHVAKAGTHRCKGGQQQEQIGREEEIEREFKVEETKRKRYSEDEQQYQGALAKKRRMEQVALHKQAGS